MKSYPNVCKSCPEYVCKLVVFISAKKIDAALTHQLLSCFYALKLTDMILSCWMEAGGQDDQGKI